MKPIKPITAIILCASLQFPILSYAAVFFQVTPTDHYESRDGVVTNFVIRSNIDRTYPNAGIRILNNPNAHILSQSSCTPLSNGFCRLSIQPGQSTLISVSSKHSERLRFQIALNALGKTPISTYEYSTSNTIEGKTSSSGRIIGYLYGWETPPTAQSIANAGYSHILIAFGLFSTTSPGTINIDAVSGFDLATYVQSLHANGIKVLLSLGGASTSIAGTTVDFNAAVQAATTPENFVTNFVNSMSNLTNTYGFDGYDFDIEHGLNAANSFSDPSQGCSLSSFSSACDIYYLTNIIQQYHTQSPGSLITLVPQIANIAASQTNSYSAIWANYSSLVMQVYPYLEWVAFQNYNSGCAYGINLVCYPTTGTLTSTTDPVVAFSTDLLANWPATTSSGLVTNFLPYISYLNPSQVVIGYVVTNSNGQTDGDPSVSPYLSVAKNAIQCLRTGQLCGTYTPPATYPNIGGVFDWTVNYDATVNYQFATTLYPCVVGGVCT